MRELELRAWDIHAKQMIYIKNLYWFEEEMVQGFDNEAYIFEQYTGLKDKNWKKIFEGDIIAHDDDYKHSGVIQFACGTFGINWDYSKNTDPEWREGKMYGSWGNEHNLRKLCDGFNRDIIVIGNIHDIPGLVGK